MTSQKQRDANRQNSLKSTGLKTKSGKQNSKQNVLKHGLASALKSGTPEDAHVRRLAAAILGEDKKSFSARIHSRDAAEAHHTSSARKNFASIYLLDTAFGSTERKSILRLTK